jgi:hypothetical protein
MALEDHKETRRLFGVMTEELRSEIRQVAEGVLVNSQKLDRLEGKLDVLAASTSRISETLRGCRSDFAELRAVEDR